MSDHCPPNNTNPYMVAAATIGVAKIVHDFSGHSVGPISGYQYTQAGSENMDNTMGLLRQRKDGSREYLIKAEERDILLNRHEVLQPEMFRLQAETRSYMGSIKNVNKGRKWYNRTTDLQYDTKSSSDRELTIYERSQAQAELGNRHDSHYTHKGDQEEEEEDKVTEDSQSSEHPWEDGRSSISCRSTGQASHSSQRAQYPQYGSTGQTHPRPHQSQHYNYPPQGAQPPRHMHAQPFNSGYPQAGSSSEYSAYAAFNNGFPVDGYPPTRPY